MASRLTTFIVVLIVAGTLIAGLIVGAQRDDASGPVDLIVTNGRVYTGQPSRFAEALAIRGNKILRVGANRDIKRLRRAQTIVVDAHGGSVLPGFNDAHVHLMSGGLALSNVNLLDATTLDRYPVEREGVCRRRIRNVPGSAGRGWYYDPFPGGLPTRQQLDAVGARSPGVPGGLRRPHGLGEHEGARRPRGSRVERQARRRRHREGSADGRAHRRAEGGGAVVDAEGAAAADARRPARRVARGHPRSAAPRGHQRAERGRLAGRTRPVRRAADRWRAAGARVRGALRHAAHDRRRNAGDRGCAGEIPGRPVCSSRER